MDRHIIHYYPRRDQKLRSIIWMALESQQRETQTIQRQCEQRPRQQILATHQYQVLESLRDQQTHRWMPLHYGRYVHITQRAKTYDARETHISSLRDIHQTALREEHQTLGQELTEHGYDISTIDQRKRPAYQRTIRDGALYNNNREQLHHYLQ